MAASDKADWPLVKVREIVTAQGKYKGRSHDTTINAHIPELEQHPGPFDVVLIGDSILERLKTTGTSTRIAQRESTFNAGVGGDKIENVLYRLGTLRMMDRLSERSVKLWVVMVGTNKLKKALKARDIELYRLLIQALRKVSPTSNIIVCELFKRKDMDDGYVDESHRMIQGMIEEVNDWVPEIGQRISLVKAPDISDEMIMFVSTREATNFGMTRCTLGFRRYLDRWQDATYGRVTGAPQIEWYGDSVPVKKTHS